MPAREVISQQLIDVVREALANGKTPIIQAYALGKAQEVSKILTDAGLPVYQDREVYEISRIYSQFGVDLGNVRLCDGQFSHEKDDAQSPTQDDLCDRAVRGGVFVVSPKRAALVARNMRNATVSIAVTGWAVDPSTRYRLSVDHALPLSDHADYDELLETVERVGPRKVFCTHGRDLEGFVNRLCELGHDAYPLGRCGQMRLF